MTLTAVKAGAYTHHLAIASPEPERLAAFYADTMDMAATPLGAAFLVRGPARVWGGASGAGRAGPVDLPEGLKDLNRP